MKTVHAWLTEVDASQLINEYFCEHPTEYENFCHLEKTVAEIKAAYRLHLLKFLEMLRNLESDKKIDHRISSAKKEEAAAPADAPNGAPVSAAASFALIG